ERHPEDAEWYTLGEFWLDVDRHTLSRDEPTVFEESGTVCGKSVFLDVHQACFIDSLGQVIGTVGSARDITERKASEVFVQHLAHHDVLTDLPNRMLFMDRLENAIERARRHDRPFALAYIDIDGFKPVNDTYGHQVGDELLKAIAGRLRGSVRHEDTVSRLGGDEFAVILEGVIDTASAAMRLCESIGRELRRPYPLQTPNGPDIIEVGASIGVALYPDHADGCDPLILAADQAMYRAKRAGKNRCEMARADLRL
uniref:GGDEF domain-containing protein n=1 Tax=uncultured Nevskia sp. TaxID=228950 RepID=UPI0025E1D0E7